MSSTYSIIAFRGQEIPGAYIGLVYSRWMKSLRYGNDFFKLSDSDAYYAAYQHYITAILSKPTSLLRLAVLTDDHDVVLGFSVSHGPALDYVHVHKDHRRHGIAAHLVGDSSQFECITHLTRTGLSIWGSKFGNWKFNPFA